MWLMLIDHVFVLSAFLSEKIHPILVLLLKALLRTQPSGKQQGKHYIQRAGT